MKNIDEVVVIKGLDEDNAWGGGWKAGGQLERHFPDQDASDLMTALGFNEPDTFARIRNSEGVKDLKLLKQGMNDEESWIWFIAFNEMKKGYGGEYLGSTYLVVTGWCDYTGWDCQSGATVTEL